MTLDMIEAEEQRMKERREAVNRKEEQDSKKASKNQHENQKQKQEAS